MVNIEELAEKKEIEVKPAKGVSYTTDSLAKIVKDYVKSGSLTKLVLEESEKMVFCKFNDFYLGLSKDGDIIVGEKDKGTYVILFKETPYLVMKDSNSDIYYVKLNEENGRLTAYPLERVEKIDEKSEVLAVIQRYRSKGKNIVEITAKEGLVKDYLDLEAIKKIYQSRR